MVKVIPMEVLVASIARASEHVPAEVELGLHLCYGDPGHKHVVEPKDTKLMVDFTNELVAAIKHPIAWVHMPVPREREDVAYFAPLKGLKIDRRTRTISGTRASYRWRGRRATSTCSGKTSCDQFRRSYRMRLWPPPAETVPDLIELHREVARAE